MTRTLLLSLVATVPLALGGVAVPDSTRGSDGATGTATDAGVGSVAAAQRREARFEVAQRFPAIELPSLEDGTPTSLADFRGTKVLLHVFASW